MITPPWEEWIAEVIALVREHDSVMATWVDFSMFSSWYERWEDEETPKEAFEDEMRYYYEE